MADSMKHNSVIRSMNPWVLHLQKLGLELKCPLCLNFLKRPFLLPCDHIFCNSCLHERTKFASECPVCKDQYVGRDLRPLPFIENMVAIYRSLDSAFCANMFQSSCSDTGKISEQCPTSAGADCNDKLSKESIGQEDNSSSGRSMYLLKGNQLAQVPLNSSQNGARNIDMADKSNVQRVTKDGEYEIVGGDAKQNINSTPISSQVRAGRLQECGLLRISTNQADQLSTGSPPSFGDVKSPENDSCDQGDDSPTNYQAIRLVKRSPDDMTSQERHDGFASGTEGGNLRDPKRHKKLDYGQLNRDTNRSSPISSQTENPGACCSQLGHKFVPPHIDGQPPALLEDSSVAKIMCGFCQSSRTSKDTGPMFHYVNGKLVEGDEASGPNALHVHRICIEWAPQVYFVDETVKNLKAELARGSKLKCSKCGLKGAALGCFQKSCRRSYHVTCAMEIAGCRWDYDNFLVLCPSHSSVRFPDEKKSKSKKHSLERHHVPTQVPPQQPNFWAESATGAKEWVFCGSALSSEEKSLLIEFGRMIGVPVTKFWQPNVTHVIAATDTKGACTRTLKVLMAILNGRWVLTIDWVKACMRSMHYVDEEPYEVSLDNHGCHSGPRTGRLSVLDNAPKLFSGLNFYFAGDFVSGYKEDLQNLVLAAGGTILDSKEKVVEQSHNEATPSRTLVVYNFDPPLGCKLGEEVTILWQRLSEAEDLAAKIGSQVIAHTWLLESIASYKFQPFVSLNSTHDDNNLLA
ncbi:brca1 associated ring domain, putative [Ricinus communis]|uniref:RING-type E3 ubiquitin transferase BRCA1 n=1 Tax=Ricinus communis TaxID=3988 RepID=B9SKQ1_RICCO|nr:brca1 associated ring domain, putative [Ricinus communis]|eukprot:XP_002526570.1 BRCA1-associated RING domain protein 1 [Ricinus communis]